MDYLSNHYQNEDGTHNESGDIDKRKFPIWSCFESVCQLFEDSPYGELIVAYRTGWTSILNESFLNIVLYDACNLTSGDVIFILSNLTLKVFINCFYLLHNLNQCRISCSFFYTDFVYSIVIFAIYTILFYLNRYIVWWNLFFTFMLTIPHQFLGGHNVLLWKNLSLKNLFLCLSLCYDILPCWKNIRNFTVFGGFSQNPIKFVSTSIDLVFVSNNHEVPFISFDNSDRDGKFFSYDNKMCMDKTLEDILIIVRTEGDLKPWKLSKVSWLNKCGDYLGVFLSKAFGKQLVAFNPQKGLFWRILEDLISFLWGLKNFSHFVSI